MVLSLEMEDLGRVGLVVCQEGSGSALDNLFP